MPKSISKLSFWDKVGYRASDLALRSVIGLLCMIPYRQRVALAGWITSRVAAPIAGFQNRVRTNLKLTHPDLPEDEVRDIVHEVCDNAGRTVIEIFSKRPFIENAAQSPLTGPGVQALEDARAEGRAVIINTAHFGNFYAIRPRLQALGYTLGSLYRRMANPYFNDFYVENLLGFGPPVFEQSRNGMRELVRHLRQGGMLGILNDVHVFGGEPLTFFGHKAFTSLSTAELALKFDCLLLPVFAIRKDDGIGFQIVVLDPVEHSDAVTMTQELNDITEKMVREHMGQWFWIHRRWKG